PISPGLSLPLTADACTGLSLQLAPFLSATVDATGSARTPEILFPSIAPGSLFWAAAFTIDPTGPAFVSVTGAETIEVQ
ncbi:MAG: hypothetical protein RL885_23855, partial [Planctomycetota bacterium]